MEITLQNTEEILDYLDFTISKKEKEIDNISQELEKAKLSYEKKVNDIKAKKVALKEQIAKTKEEIRNVKKASK